MEDEQSGQGEHRETHGTPTQDESTWRRIKPFVDGERAALTIRMDLHSRRRWRCVEIGDDGSAWRSQGLSVIWSVSEEQDGRVWLHVSAARADRLPSYSDMANVKRLFIGPSRYAYSVWASDAMHVNIHPYVLHLWCALSGDEPMPDFTRQTGSI